MRHVVLAVATAVLGGGCGSSTVLSDAEPVDSSYRGPVYLPMQHRHNASVLDRSGAAGRAVECDGDPYDGGGADYDSGLVSVQGSATQALENFLEEGLSAQVPSGGYRIEREDDGRVLFSYDVGGQTKVAFIAANRVRDYNDAKGWGVEAWAQCDPAELPTDVTEALGIQVWQDQIGARVPVTQVWSFQGPEHCGWQDITFLVLGAERDAGQYVRDTAGELADFLRTTYDDDAKLPKGATDTGFRRDGRELWLGPRSKAAYLVSAKNPQDVERWPAAKDSIGCA